MQAETLAKSTHAAAFNVFLARVKTALQPLPTMVHWTAKSTSAGGSVLPTFSVEPLGYVTALGEHLILLPQQLEVLLGDELLSTAMTEVRAFVSVCVCVCVCVYVYVCACVLVMPE